LRLRIERAVVAAYSVTDHQLLVTDTVLIHGTSGL
jgi:hypothetical protein